MIEGGARALRDRPLRGDSSLPSWTVKADLGASYTVEMSVDAWINLADHPRRRDTERHIRKARVGIADSHRPRALCLKCCAGSQPGQVWR